MKYLFALLISLAPGFAAAQDLTVFAAASLKEPLDQIVLTQPDVAVAYGGSGTLARQIMAGAPADLVILAHPDWMDALEQDGALVPGSRVDLLSNEIVLVAPQETPALDLTALALADALGPDGRLAIGMTASVPAGIYGRQALTALDLWDGVSDRLAESDSVRGALALVANGEAPLGLVYATDARVEPTLKIVARFPTDSHAPILYQAGVLRGGQEDRAQALLDVLQSPEGMTSFAGAGFLPVGQP